MTPNIRIVVVDDHALLRGGLVVQLDGEEDMEVVGSCPDAETAIAQVAQHRPDVVLMDIDLPGLNCFAACRLIAGQSQSTRVIFLSAYGHDRWIDQALEVQAWGYVTKSESFSEVCEAIRSVVQGRVHFSDDIKSRLVAGRDGLELKRRTRSRASTLSPRELEVLRYLARGLAVKDVARTMHLSAKTVDNHKSKIMAKLDIHDRVTLARFAYREGIATV